MPAFDVIFIGGGPAGYVGALRCAQLGLSTAVVEREALGGTCVLWGCIPAKALLESAAVAQKVAHAKEFGVTVGDVQLDYGVAMKRSRAVSTQNSKGVEFLFKKNKVTHIKGTGTLTGAERYRELGVEKAGSSDDVYAEADFITIHLPKTPETEGWLNAEAFAKMKDGVRILVRYEPMPPSLTRRCQRRVA